MKKVAKSKPWLNSVKNEEYMFCSLLINNVELKLAETSESFKLPFRPLYRALETQP